MFTNWLTSPTTTTTAANQSLNSFNMGQLSSSSLMATPPDIILEVGPQPSIRFVAHSALLAMHSGYLRSAIRLDENNANLQNNANAGLDLLPPIYLTNVTPEQFGPLLTYMYTGYLDLTLENIFGVLLATHVLHMPRALEICRAFLSRSQAEGYLSGGFLNQVAEASSGKTSKVIRPIASKPLISNLGFIVPPMQHPISLPTTGTQFRCLSTGPTTSAILNTIERISPKNKSEEIGIRLETVSSGSSSPIEPVKSPSPKEQFSTFDQQTPKRPSKFKRRHSCSESKSQRASKIHQSEPSTSVAPSQKVAVTTTLATHQDAENKVIIDVASCDGPVRFRRVLNDAYGQQPDTVHLPVPSHERSHQSLSYSFHQQMAKNISQQRQHHHHHQSEESENSEDLKSGEIFNCVYCRHTFKSQYCYQKHAKRHLNPLSLEHGEGIILAPAATTFGELLMKKDEKSTSSSRSPQCITPLLVPSTNSTSIPSDVRSPEQKSAGTKREVRPLDMNVQYYPCKTCGSKFPSYYFVHKHRKLCHANEEN